MSNSTADDPLLATVPKTADGYPSLGGIKILKKIGQGGMGAVYEGHHEALDIHVAVKVLPSHLATQNESFVKRFVQEARTAAKIDHPNLIRVINVGEESGIFFLVMEFVDGYSAKDLLDKQGALSERQALEITLGAAHGLKAAHDKHIIHRDMKPDNIMIRAEDGRIKVSDLGLAKITGTDDAAADAANEGMGLTASGAALGTPYYMPPEQAMDAKTADHRADIYSLGATLYHMLAGETPFQASSLLPLLMKIRDELPPDIKEKRPDIQDITRDLINKSMEKNPDDRYQTMTEFITDMEKALENASGAGGGYAAAGTAIGTVSPSKPVLDESAYANTLATGAEEMLATDGGDSSAYAQTLTMDKTVSPPERKAAEAAALAAEAAQAPRTAGELAAEAGGPTKSNTGMIIGVILGAVVLAAGVIVAIVFMGGKKPTGETETAGNETVTPAVNAPKTTPPASTHPPVASMKPAAPAPSDLSAENLDKWKALISAARKAFENGDYQAAVDEYRAAKDIRSTGEIEKALELAENRLAESLNTGADSKKLKRLSETLKQADAAAEKDDKAKAEELYGKVIVEATGNAKFEFLARRAENALEKLRKPAPDTRQPPPDNNASANAGSSEEKDKKLRAQFRKILDEAKSALGKEDFKAAKLKLETVADEPKAPVDIQLSARETLAKVSDYLETVAAADAAVNRSEFDVAEKKYSEAAKVFASKEIENKRRLLAAARKKYEAQLAAERRTSEEAEKKKRAEYDAAVESAMKDIAAEKFRGARAALEDLVAKRDAPEDLRKKAAEQLRGVNDYIGLIADGDAALNVRSFDAALDKYRQASAVFASKEAAARMKSAKEAEKRYKEEIATASTAATAEKKAEEYRKSLKKAQDSLSAGDIPAGKYILGALAAAGDAPLEVKASAKSGLDKVGKYERLVADAGRLAETGKYAEAKVKYGEAAGLFNTEDVRAKLEAVKKAEEESLARSKAEEEARVKAEAERRARIVELQNHLQQATEKMDAGDPAGAIKDAAAVLKSEDATPQMIEKAKNLTGTAENLLEAITAFRQYMRDYGPDFEKRALNDQSRNKDYETRLKFVRDFPGHPLADKALLPVVVRSGIDGVEVLLDGEQVANLQRAGTPAIVAYDPRKPHKVSVKKEMMKPGELTTVAEAGAGGVDLFLFPKDPVTLTPKLEAEWSYSPPARPVTGLCAAGGSLFCGLESGGLLVVTPESGKAVTACAESGVCVSTPLSKGVAAFAALHKDGMVTFVKLDSTGKISWKTSVSESGRPRGRLTFIGGGKYVVQAFSKHILVADTTAEKTPMGYPYPAGGTGGAARVNTWLLAVPLTTGFQIVNIADARTFPVKLTRGARVQGELAGGSGVVIYDGGRGSVVAYNLGEKNPRMKLRANRHRGRTLGNLVQAGEDVYFVTDANMIYAVHPSTRVAPPRLKRLPARPNGVMSVSGDYVIVPTADGKVIVVDRNTLDPLPPVEVPDGKPVRLPGAVIGDMLYLATDSGILVGVRMRR